MNKTVTIASAFLAMLGTSAIPTQAAMMKHSTMKHGATKHGATMYSCVKCHMQYTAAQAKKDHYKDPMDGGKLVPVSAKMHSSMSKMSGSMGKM